MFSCQTVNFLTNEILWTFLSSQSKSEKSYRQCSRHFELNSLSFVYGKFTASFPTFNPGIWPLWGLVIVKNKLTSVFYASVFLLKISFVITLSKFTAEPLACGSRFHSHFDNVMTQFTINKRTDAWKTDVNLLISITYHRWQNCWHIHIYALFCFALYAFLFFYRNIFWVSWVLCVLQEGQTCVTMFFKQDPLKKEPRNRIVKS